jgi:hypothetical protein
MAIEITLTVRTTNHGDDTVITKTYASNDGNPRFDGLIVREQAAELANHIASAVDRLADSPVVNR